MKTPIIISRSYPLLPYEVQKLEIGRPNSINAVEIALKNKNNEIIIISQLDPDRDEIKSPYQLQKVGTLAKIVSLFGDSESGYEIEIIGVAPVIINFEEDEITKTEYDYDLVIEQTLETTENKIEIEKINSQILNTIVKRKKHQNVDFNEMHSIFNFEKEKFAYKAAATFLEDSVKDESIDFTSISNERISILSKTTQYEAHYEILKILFKILTDLSSIEQEVERTVNDIMNNNMQKQQREFFLREKLKVVKEQLGELSTREEEADKMREKVETLKLPKDIKERVLSELSRFESAASPVESALTKTYLDWLLDLPWSKMSEDNKDFVAVKNHLDSSHYGIQKVKQRILEYLALKTRNPDVKAPIICLVGPPGVGKTSLVTSIAKALNKEFIKVSLGGVRDESEIRGHRKTYVGAMPGRIIKGMKKAGVINPLFLLDEIDKMTSDSRGDPAAALLEVLDPEQNKRFSDNYIEEEYDLSKVMFMATANYYQQIPHALIDRLEVIELSSYTAIEKREIAKTHLLKKIFNDAKLNENQLLFSDEIIDFIIEHYTKEAGVRELDRQLNHIVRKYLVESMSSNQQSSKVVLNKELINKYLGKIKYDFTSKDDNIMPGVVNGMAYTSAGGDLLPIEVNYSSVGKGGNITITGNLEKTMNESVNVALGYVKANAVKYGIDLDKINFKEIDIHVHVPQGGVPKDGPSAGITITTAIISALSNRPVRSTISMTGEIMLRGNVGIIGGVKEKILSAYRGGVREIIIPYEDERFLEDVPQYILDDIKIHLVKHYDEVYDIVFAKSKNKSKK